MSQLNESQLQESTEHNLLVPPVGNWARLSRLLDCQQR